MSVKAAPPAKIYLFSKLWTKNCDHEWNLCHDLWLFGLIARSFPNCTSKELMEGSNPDSLEYILEKAEPGC